MYENEDIILGKLRTNREQLENMAKYLSTPVATYTYNLNKEVVVSAVDTTADNFTSVAHGLSNGDQLYPILNVDAGNIYMIDKLPGGISYVDYPGYFVVNKTNDTFQLSLTSGGAAIDLTTNANLDLTKWHFERNNGSSPVITIAGLSLTKARVFINGRSIRKNASVAVYPNALPDIYVFAISGQTGMIQSPVFESGDVSFNLSCDINSEKILTIRGKGGNIKSASATTVTATALDKGYLSPKYVAVTIASVFLSGMYPANGTKVEVYKA